MIKINGDIFLTTRDKILHHLLLHCYDPCSSELCTAKGIADVLNLTTNCVRQHIAILARDNLVTFSEKKRKIGRPAIVYSLHENALELFPKNYAEFGTLLLKEMIDTYGKDAAEKLLVKLGKQKALLVKKELPENINAGSSMYQKVLLEILVKVYNQMGKIAELIEEEDHYIIKTHNCLLYSIFKGDSIICNIDETIVKELFGKDSIKDICIRDGNGYCMYIIKKMISDRESAYIDENNTAEIAGIL